VRPDYDHPSWENKGLPDKKENAEAFYLDCCTMLGNFEGCVVARHSPRNEQTTKLSTATPPSKKRKAYETCVNCEDSYDADRNSMGDCVYHPGTTSLHSSYATIADVRVGELSCDHDCTEGTRGIRVLLRLFP